MAIVTDTGKVYGNYKDFAVKHGHLDAVRRKKNYICQEDSEDQNPARKGDEVKVLVKDKHHLYNETLYIVKHPNYKVIINERGLRLTEDDNIESESYSDREDSISTWSKTEV